MSLFCFGKHYYKKIAIYTFFPYLIQYINISLQLFYFLGQPYNQLAILEAARGNKLTTVFYYIRSLAVRHPFPVAATNLEKFYGKLAKDSYVHFFSKSSY